MGIRPDVHKEVYDEIIQIANKNSKTPVRDFNDACVVILTLIKTKGKKI